MMKRYLNSFKQNANLSSRGAMESGDHFKNGASPKSLMSRGSLVVILLFFTAVICSAQTVKYDSIAPYSEGMAAVKLGDKWGYIDENKKLVIPIQYYNADPFSEGLASIMDNNRKQGYIDKTGRLVIPYKFDGTGKFSEGLADVYGNEDKVGYIDKTGRLVIPYKFDGTGEFKEGLAVVKLNGKCGFIDKTGKEVIPCKYEYAKDFSFGYAFVKLEDGWQIINQKGEEFELELLDEDLELRRLGVNGKIAYIDKTDKLVTPLKYDRANKFSDEKKCAKVQIGDKFGIVGKNGEIITPKYEDVKDFYEDIFVVELNEKYGAITKLGKEIIPMKYDYVVNYRDIFVVGLNKKYGVITKLGKEITPMKYDKISYDNGDCVIRVCLNRKWNCIDKNGKEMKYDDYVCFDDITLVKFNGKWGGIDNTGKEVIPIIYGESSESNYGGPFFNLEDNLAIVTLNNKMGVINKTGKEVVPIKYDMVKRLEEGGFGVKLGNEVFHIDTKGIRTNKKVNSELFEDVSWDW